MIKTVFQNINVFRVWENWVFHFFLFFETLEEGPLYDIIYIL